MTIREMCDLWDLARVIHEAREKVVWGADSTKHPWLDFTQANAKAPPPYITLALASAKAVVDNFKIDLK